MNPETGPAGGESFGAMTGPVSWLQRAKAAEDAVVALLMATIMAIGLAGVVMRYVFAAPLSWPEELNRHLLVVLTYLGAYINVSRNQNIRATTNLTGLLGPRLRRLAMALLELTTSAFCAYFAYLSFSVIMKLLSKKLVALPSVPVAAFNIFVPAFLAIIALLSLWRCVLHLRGCAPKGADE